MKKYSADEIRNLWLQFWKSKDHRILSSASLIPKNDSSLLWINSGVAVLKDYFSGLKIPVHRRLTNSQKSIRTNDIENVGMNSRHHTLFEMLGSFSIGDYFKDEALLWAFEFLFDVLKFNKDDIYITYYHKDKYTYNKWLELGIDAGHLIAGDRKSNFWDLGSGPCGPDTEIFYDRGVQYDPQKQGIKYLQNDEENDRYIEIWNIVFSEFDNIGNGKYIELKQKNIDTGAGLERIVSIFQNAPTNFDTDLFLPIIRETEKMTDKNNKYVIANYFKKDIEQAKINKCFRIIADHMRAICQTINDGAIPSNTKRGYVIRKLIRRAYYSGIKIGIQKKTFLHNLVEVVNDALPVYPLQIDYVKKIVKNEEIVFYKTIKNGEKFLSNFLNKNNNFDSKIIFKLFETYGFPVELSIEILKKNNFNFDLEKIKKLQEQHILVSQNQKFSKKQPLVQITKNVCKKMSTFIGYDYLSSNSKILVQEKINDKYYLLLDKTPFYATKGGQIHDLGVINNVPVLEVFCDAYNNHWHIIASQINAQYVTAKVDAKIRLSKARNHSATHLLQYVLRNFISSSIIQIGSENNDQKLRFDFPLTYKLTSKEITKVEKEVNNLIKNAIPREYIIEKFGNGIKRGALVVETEIDTDPNKLSRIVKFANSIEFCGGTHVANTSDIEKFKIIKIELKGAGTYRIEAITSQKTIDDFELKSKLELIAKLKILHKTLQAKGIAYDFNYKNKNLKELTKMIKTVQQKIKIWKKSNKNLKIDFKVTFKDYKKMSTFIKLDLEPQNVKFFAIKLREIYPNKLFIIGAKKDNHLLIAITSQYYSCNKIFSKLIKDNNGKGGGNKNFAMGMIKKFKY